MAPGTVGEALPRIVYITNVLSPYRVRFLQELNALGEARIEIWLMAWTERNRRWTAEVSDGLNIRVFRDWGIDLSHRAMVILHYNPGMLRELRRNPPDLVLLGGYESPTCKLAASLLRRHRIPFAFKLEAADLGPVPTTIPWRLVARLRGGLLRSADGIVVVGSASRQHALRHGVSPDRIFLSPNSVDPDRFHPVASEEARRQLRADLGLPDGIVCLCVGGLSARKGLDQLLEAFRRVAPSRPRLHLVLVGEGLLLPTLRATVEGDPALRHQVHLLGYASDDRLRQIYPASDIFVFATKFDVWGLVLNEAMSAGIPVISSDHAGGARDLIESGVNGLVVPSGDVGAFAASIAFLCDDEGVRQQMGRLGRERILAAFTPKHQAKSLMAAIQAILARRGMKPRLRPPGAEPPLRSPVAVAPTAPMHTRR